MKSVGEAMSIGRTFCEALQKAARSLEIGAGRPRVARLARRLPAPRRSPRSSAISAWKRRRSSRRRASRRRAPRSSCARCDTVIPIPVADRLFYVADAMRAGIDERRDPRAHDRPVVPRADHAHREGRRAHDARRRRRRRRCARQATRLLRRRNRQAHRLVRRRRARAPQEGDVVPVYARVDTCAAEFVAHTPYLYSTYETESEAKPDSTKKKVVILGGGPTASARASSSTTAACTRCRRCVSSGSRP